MNGSTTKCRGVKPSAGFKGFTLIELMITVAIVAILATIALPAYQDSVRKARRAEGKACLLNGAQKQERYFYQNNTYADTLVKLGFTDPYNCPEGSYYQLSVTSGTATAFTLTATAMAPQTSDTKCMNLRLTNAGVKSATGSDPTQCW